MGEVVAQLVECSPINLLACASVGSTRSSLKSVRASCPSNYLYRLYGFLCSN